MNNYYITYTFYYPEDTKLLFPVQDGKEIAETSKVSAVKSFINSAKNITLESIDRVKLISSDLYTPEQKLKWLMQCNQIMKKISMTMNCGASFLWTLQKKNLMTLHLIMKKKIFFVICAYLVKLLHNNKIRR